MKKVLLAVLMVGFLVTGFSMNIVETAVSAGNFTTLVKAVQEAGLVEALSGEGPFTVFAPTDEAFAKLPEGTVEALLDDIPTLTNILLYHVVAGKFMSGDVVAADSLTTLEGSDISIRVEDGKVYVNDAIITVVDIETSNGVIHVIDSVILPPEKETRTIVEIAIEAGIFTTLVAAVQEAGLVDALMGEGPFTVFAPTDRAFSRISKERMDSLLNNTPALTELLLFHVVPGEYRVEDLVDFTLLQTLQGQNLIIEPCQNHGLHVNGATVITANIIAANGVIHVIDQVMIPLAD